MSGLAWVVYLRRWVQEEEQDCGEAGELESTGPGPRRGGREEGGGKSLMNPERLMQDQFWGARTRGSVWGHVECVRALGCLAVGKVWVRSLGKGASECWWK